MMDPGPIAFTRMLCGASESAMHLLREHAWIDMQSRHSDPAPELFAIALLNSVGTHNHGAQSSRMVQS